MNSGAYKVWDLTNLTRALFNMCIIKYLEIKQYLSKHIIVDR